MGSTEVLAERRRNRDTTCCPTGPFGDAVSRARATTLEYLDILLQWTDKLIKQNSKEGYQKAIVLAGIMERILGPNPTRVEAEKGIQEEVPTVDAFTPLPMPLNPRLLQLYEEVADRKALIHNYMDSCRSNAGKRSHDVAVWGAQSRFGENVAFTIQSSEDLCSDAFQCYMARCQPYRFTALIPKAMEWALMVKALGASLLSAFEKGDAEYLSALRRSHEHQILSLGIKTSQNNFRAADWDYQALGKQLAGAQTRARYYLNLIEKGIISLELNYQQGMETSMQARASGNIEETVSQAMNMIPDFYAGVSFLTHLPIGTKLAGFFKTLARVQNVIADINTSQAALSETQASWLRRAEEWQHQLNVTEIEIEQIKRQQLASARRRQSALRDLNNHQRQLEHSQEVADFMRDRLCKNELYLFLQRQVSVMYKQAFRLALQSAQEAQAAVCYEQGDLDAFVNGRGLDFGFSEHELWNSLHEGLLAGEKLELSLRALERRYMTSACREYELTKHISLRQAAPFAFLTLKTGEECELEIPEWWFDLDHLGHYMRRIKSVSLTLPCVAGPFTGVHCRLELLSSKVRVRPLLPPAPECCCDCGEAVVIDESPNEEREVIERTPSSTLPKKHTESPHLNDKNCRNCTCGPNAKQLPEDPYILHAHHTSSPHMAIATSSGQADARVFDTTPEQARYLPFEYAGAISKWRISLPAQNNAFALNTLSDVVMHITYLGREGGQELRQAAEKAVCGRMLGNGVRFVDVKHDMAEAWRVLLGPPFPVEPGSSEDEAIFRLEFTKNMFPFVQGGRSKDVWITRIHVFVEIMDEEYASADECDGIEDAMATHFEVLYHPPEEPPAAREMKYCGHGTSAQHTEGSRKHHQHTKKSKRHQSSHFFNYDSDSSSDSSSNSSSSSSSSNSHSCPTPKKPCNPDLRRKFALVSSRPCPPPSTSSRSPCCPTSSTSSASTVYSGTLTPLTPLGPITEDRGRTTCSQRCDLGALVFPAEMRERDVEAVYLLVEYEFRGRGLRPGRNRGWQRRKRGGGREERRTGERCCG